MLNPRYQDTYIGTYFNKAKVNTIIPRVSVFCLKSRSSRFSFMLKLSDIRCVILGIAYVCRIDFKYKDLGSVEEICDPEIALYQSVAECLLS